MHRATSQPPAIDQLLSDVPIRAPLGRLTVVFSCVFPLSFTFLSPTTPYQSLSRDPILRGFSFVRCASSFVSPGCPAGSRRATKRDIVAPGIDDRFVN